MGKSFENIPEELTQTIKNVPSTSLMQTCLQQQENSNRELNQCIFRIIIKKLIINIHTHSIVVEDMGQQLAQELKANVVGCQIVID
ncbi:hypothetical protein [Wolbachia endosymbiont of Encarsia formosa]|uniref:hypothetical protein n=1 Tax=Wolbachia endosymbiont of Encarsia formosa TaxID=77125 RepID=UPI0031B9B98D